MYLFQTISNPNLLVKPLTTQEVVFLRVHFPENEKIRGKLFMSDFRSCFEVGSIFSSHRSIGELVCGGSIIVTALSCHFTDACYHSHDCLYLQHHCQPALSLITSQFLCLTSPTPLMVLITSQYLDLTAFPNPPLVLITSQLLYFTAFPWSS